MSDSNSELVVGALIALVTALITAIAGSFWKWLTRPQIDIQFGKGEEHHSETETNILGHNEIYLRPKVINVGPRFVHWIRPTARCCSANLVEIEEYSENRNKYEPTIYVDNISLAWSCQVGSSRWKLDIHPDIAQFFDLVSFAKDTSHGLRPFEPKIRMTPFRYKNHLFNKIGKFRFTVLITGENIDAVKRRFILEWHGKSDNYHAHIEPKELLS